MKRRGCLTRSVAVLTLLIALTLPLRLRAQGLDLQGARKEGKVVVYAVIPPQLMKPINDAFEKQYGVKVDYWRASTTGVLDRALNEWRAGQPGYDVVEGNKGPQLILKGEGVFAKFPPPSAGKFPKQFLEPDAVLTPWRFNPISILYNTELVKKEDVPKSLGALLLPKWKSQIAMPDPSRHTTTAEFLVNLGKYEGIHWKDFTAGLARQQPLLVESFAPIVNTIIRGEAALGLAYLKYVIQFKGPIDYARLDKYLADTNYLAVSKKSPHPNAAKLYVEFLCSPAGQKAVAETGEFVLSPGIAPAVPGADLVAERSDFMDEPSAAEFKKLQSDLRLVFFSGK